MPDKVGALEQARAALRPGARYAAVVFAEPDRNRFFSVPVAIIRERGELLEDAGFADVELQRVEAPLRIPRAADCMRLERDSFGALHQMLARLTPAEQDEVWDEIGRALREFEAADGFSGPCELIVGGGTA